MKILIVIDYWFPGIGGGPVNVAEIATRINKYSNTEVQVITSNLLTGKKRNIYFNQYPDLPVIRLGHKASYHNLVSRIQFLISLFIFLLRSDFDILHIHPYSPLLIAKLIAWLKRKPVLVTVHVMGKEISGVGKKRILSQLLQLLDRVVTFYIPYDAQIFVDKQLMRQKNFTKKRFYIPNGVDVKKFDQVKVKKNRIFQILFVGRFHPQKNLKALITAFKNILQEYKANLVLIGEGEQESQLKNMLLKLNLNKEVTIVKPLFGKELIKMYKSSHLFVLPSCYEGFPITILEAWAAKIPVLATPVGMVAKLVKEEENGFLLKSQRVSDIQAGLLKALRSENLSLMGERGYELVSRHYSWNKIAAETYKVYKSLLPTKKDQ